jgi:hypothetical protein
MTDDVTFTNMHKNRLAWFCLDPKARSYLMTSSSTTPLETVETNVPCSTFLTYLETAIYDRSFLFLVIELVHFSHSFLMNVNHDKSHDTSIPSASIHYSDIRLDVCICAQDEYRRKVQTILDRLAQLHIPNIIVFMIECARFTQSKLLTDGIPSFTNVVRDLVSHKQGMNSHLKTTTMTKPQDRAKRLLHWMNESIVLLHALVEAGDVFRNRTTGNKTFDDRHHRMLSTEQRLDYECALRNSLSSTFENLFYRVSMDWCVSSPISLLLSLADCRSNPLISSCSFKQSILAQPRRHVTIALRERISHLDQSNIGNDVALVYSVFNARIIDVSTWFFRFTNELDTVDNEVHDRLLDRSPGLLQRFAFAVYQLVHMGIVSKSRRNDEIFEKNTMVWASS